MKRASKNTSSLKYWQKLADQRIGHLILISQKLGIRQKINSQGKNHWSVEVLLVGRIRMKEFNQTYRGKSTSTDVLSFPTIPLFRKRGYLGQLVICLPILKQQARRLSHSPEYELDVLLVHGLLHLLGWDHEKSDVEAKKMSKLESQILGKMKLGLIQRGMLQFLDQ